MAQKPFVVKGIKGVIDDLSVPWVDATQTIDFSALGGQEIGVEFVDIEQSEFQDRFSTGQKVECDLEFPGGDAGASYPKILEIRPLPPNQS